MKKMLALMAGIILLGSDSYAGNGDLIVDGNMGVGTGTPTARLTVNGNISLGGSTNTTSILNNTGSNDGPFIQMFGKDQTVDTSRRGELSLGGYGSTGNIRFFNYDPNYYWAERMRITPAGKVGIGVTNPLYKLDVAGVVASNGTVLTSDINFKKDIQPIESSLEKVLSLNGVSFQWKTDEYQDKGFPYGRHYGVIAQEIEQVLPEVVNTAPDGTKSVAYNEIIPILIEAIKEQQKKIEALEKKVK